MKVKEFLLNTLKVLGALFSLVRGITIIGMVAVTALTGYMIYTIYNVTVNQYNETITWKNTAYDMPLAEIEPALVANTLDTDVVTAASAWEALEEYLDNLNGAGSIDREEAEEILNEAVKWQEAYNLSSDAITRLSLYLEIDDAISESYVTMDTLHLQELAQSLYNLELEEHTALGQQYMEKLRTVSADFADAKVLMEDTIQSIGTISGGTWTIPYTYTRTDLTEVLEKLQEMQKFQAMKNIADILSDIADVLNYNKNAKEYFEFQSLMDVVNNTTRSDYVPVSSIYTYGDALDFGCIVEPQYREGYNIALDSPVTGLYYNGERLNSSEYIRRGAQVTAEITESYEPIEPEEFLSEEWHQPDEGEHQDSQSHNSSQDSNQNSNQGSAQNGNQNSNKNKNDKNKNDTDTEGQGQDQDTGDQDTGEDEPETQEPEESEELTEENQSQNEESEETDNEQRD